MYDFFELSSWKMISFNPIEAFSNFIFCQLDSCSAVGKSNNSASCVLLNFPSTLNVSSNIAPLKKRRFFGSLTFCSSCDVDDSDAILQS